VSREPTARVPGQPLRGADGLEIRLATPADWDGLWPIWHEIVAAGQTYAFDPATPKEEARGYWLLPPPAETWLVADRDRALSVPDGQGEASSPGTPAAGPAGVILGTYVLKPNQRSLGAHVANAGYMVAAAARGRGIGRRLAVHSLARARALGYLAMQFNSVVATNTGAIALWHALGFQTVGTVPGGFRHATHGLVDIHVMHRFL
jgi:ribosomal protein S18 acetylase RimI-like enzyme